MKSMFQTMLEQALNHYGTKAVVEALDFIASLTEDDMKEWTALMTDADKQRAYHVWKAAQPISSTLPTIPPPRP